MAQQQRLTSYKTNVFQDNGYTCVRCHSTVIVKFNSSEIILNSGGWRTKKTKDDMNRAACQFGLMFSVFQKQHIWYVNIGGRTIPYEDGMTIPRKLWKACA